MRLAVLGVGLIGGSLARALRPEVHTIVGWGRRIEALEKAKALGVIDRYARSIPEAIRGAEAVAVAVPPSAIPGVLAQLKGLGEGAVAFDVASVKGFVVEAARKALGERLPRFVPAHPIAGSERSGVEASRADLFRGRRVVLTPLPETSPSALERVRALWLKTGAIVEAMPAERHDAILARTSHLPHMVAYALMGMQEEEALKFSAGGLRDITRIAASDPALWRDIALANRVALLEAVEGFERQLAGIKKALEEGDGDKLLALLEAGQARRNALDACMSNPTAE